MKAHSQYYSRAPTICASIIVVALHSNLLHQIPKLHMLSQRTAWAIPRQISTRCCFSRPYLFHLGTSSRPNGPTITPITSQMRQSSSSVRWRNRQGRDPFAREAKVQGLKSRAAFKLLEVCFILSVVSSVDEGRSTRSTNFLREGRLW